MRGLFEEECDDAELSYIKTSFPLLKIVVLGKSKISEKLTCFERVLSGKRQGI